MSRNKNKHIPNKGKKMNILEGKTFVGKLDLSRQGLGFVIVEHLESDILVRPEDLKNALKGDIVRVQIMNVSKNGRMEGKIIELIEHSQNEFIGTLEVSDNFAFLKTDQDNMRFDLFIPLKKLKGGKNGDKALARITEWSEKGKKPEAEIVEILSNQRENEIAMKEILIEQGFPLHFSKQALKETDELPTTLDEQEIQNRKDCRDILTFTIDPADAKDFDDAISIRKLKNGHVEVGVHIADVSYYVKPEMELDKEALKRACSVYLPDRVLPMLPEKISNQLCSLRPHEDKFTFSAIFQLDHKGNVKQYWLGRTVIHSDKRMSYEDAQEIIENKEGELSEEILLLHEITQNLRSERFKKGAINFSSQEIRFKLDENGIPVGIEIKESKEANQLIEELMLLANRTVATYVGKKKMKNQVQIPFPYRVHDVPNEDKLAVFAAFASRFGYHLNLNSPQKIAETFNQMLKEVQGKPEQHVLEQLGIRTMSKALYTTDNIGHYGLGFEDYGHFTSPIRRYPDIMVHRIVQECIEDKVNIDKKMESKARHCSNQERKAMDAERTAHKYKQVEYMQKFIGEEFDAIISGVAPFGFWAETIEHKCEGLISVADLEEVDDFEFLEAEYALRGLHTGQRFQMGDKVKIKVIATSLEKKQIDFGFVEMETKNKSSKKTKNKK